MSCDACERPYGHHPGCVVAVREDLSSAQDKVKDLNKEIESVSEQLSSVREERDDLEKRVRELSEAETEAGQLEEVNEQLVEALKFFQEGFAECLGMVSYYLERGDIPGAQREVSRFHELVGTGLNEFVRGGT